MSLDAAQNASAVTDLVFAGLKVAGYSVTFGSIFASGSYTVKYFWHREKRMKETVAHWRNVLAHLDEKQKNVIGQRSLDCMNRKLDQMERWLSTLAINLPKTTIWSRTVGEHAGRVRKLERLVEEANTDLTARTEEALRVDEKEIFETKTQTPNTPQPSADPHATSAGVGREVCAGRGQITTSSPPCAEVARPSPALLAPYRQPHTAQFTAALPQYTPPYIPCCSDYGEDIV